MEKKDTKDAKEIAVELTPRLRLLAAVHKAQRKIGTVKKNSDNPYYKSKYATLDEIWEKVKPILNDEGLITMCTVEDGILTTHLIEVTGGEEMTSSFPVTVANGDPQKIGSAMTYARRYTLSALLQIVTAGEDDDGNAASNIRFEQQPRKPIAQTEQPKPLPPWKKAWDLFVALDVNKGATQEGLKTAFNNMCLAVTQGKSPKTYTAEDWAKVEAAIKEVGE